MTTSLTKSTIPAYNPENDYFSPRQVPRVKQEAMNNYYKNRGSLDMTLSNTQETEKVYAPKVKYEVAEKAYLKNRGSMGELLSGYPDPAHLRKGPRVTGAAQSNYIKNRGTFNNILDQNANRNDRPETHVPKVYYEGRDNREQGNGTVGNLFNYYGALPQSARQVPRVKAEATYNYEHGRGSAMGKALTMVPQSSRPGSATFFDMKP